MKPGITDRELCSPHDHVQRQKMPWTRENRPAPFFLKSALIAYWLGASNRRGLYMTDHIDNRLLVAYAVELVIDEETLAKIEEHLLVCQQCRDVVTLADRWRNEDTKPT